MSTAAITLADKNEKTFKPSGFKKQQVVKMKSGKFSRIFLNLLNKTRKLELSQEQVDEINTVRREYYSQISSQEKKSRKLQLDFMKQLESEEYKPLQLKSLNDQIQLANQKAADSFIEGLTMLIDIVGTDKFAKLYPLSKINRSALVQLREQENNPKANIESPADKEPKSEADNK